MLDIFAENREMGWIQLPDAPDWVKEHWRQQRTAQLEKRPVDPRYLALYHREAEQRSLTTFARNATRTIKKIIAPILPRPADIDAANRRRAAELAETIRRDESLEQKRTRIDAVMRSAEQESQKVLCPASSTVADRAAHLRAADFHNICGRSAKTLAVGARHFAAADAHRLAAENPISTNKIAAVAACKACEVDGTRFQMLLANK